MPESSQVDNRPKPMRISAVRITALVLAIGIPLALLLLARTPSPGNAGGGYSLRFYGHGVNDIDRVKIRIDPQVPVDLAGDMTLEFWMLAFPGENGGGGCPDGNNNWIFGNTIFDRDVFGDGDYGDYGVSLRGGRIAFGVDAQGGSGWGICSSTNLADSAWHHIAVTRQTSNGQMRIFVDGQQEASATGPTGNMSYRNGRPTSYPNSDPYLVIGAEKHDAGGSFPSFSGFVDEVRISNVVRYTGNFTPPSGPFNTDGSTVGLYHFDEGPAGACTGQILDSSGASGGPSHGSCKFGGSSPGGPVYSSAHPWSGPPPTPPGSTSTPIGPTNTPTRTASPTPIPTCVPTPTSQPFATLQPGIDPDFLPLIRKHTEVICIP